MRLTAPRKKCHFPYSKVYPCGTILKASTELFTIITKVGTPVTTSILTEIRLFDGLTPATVLWASLIKENMLYTPSPNASISFNLYKLNLEEAA